jgi:DNA-binding CsgD family transcriptional regulator
MKIQFQFLILIVSLASGMIAIILSNRLMRKYPLSYLSSYFYFLVFTYIFSAYSIVGSQSIRFLLKNHSASAASIESSEAILIVLGIPFLILSWYMFIRISREFYKTELPKIFVILYFLLFAISFVGYALMNLDLSGLETINFFMDAKQLLWTYTVLLAMVFGSSLVYVFIKTNSLNDINQRKAYQWFAIWYCIITVMSIISLHLSSIHIIFGLLFIAVLTGFHLVPVLFLNIYLQRFFVSTVETGSFSDKLELMTVKYEISKRETEIVELICKGMSNQEISNSLFISLQTVKDHVYRIFLKTGVKNRVQLTNLVSSF